MKLLYAENIDQIEIDAEEFKHLKAMRVQAGDQIHFTDGKGGHATTMLDSVGKRSASFTVLTRTQEPSRRSYYMHIIIAPTKNIQRIEWMVEKLTEIGVDEITFVQCRQSERYHLKMDRLERKARSAMKQCLGFQTPIINTLKSYTDFIQENASEPSQLKLIAHLNENCISIKQTLEQNTHNHISILIGPEGDFHPEEVSLAESHGWQSISLGPSRLRTETAGIVAATTCYYHESL